MNECDVFMAALEIESSEERDTYLDEACGKDTSLRRRVEGLLECHARSGSLLEHPAVEGATAQLFGEVNKLALSGSDDGGSVPPLDEISLDFLDPSDAPDLLGRLGPYKITEVVGRGGMGIVLKGQYFQPSLTVEEREIADLEGWILGIM